MNPNLIPTESEIEQMALRLFGTDESAKSSFIQGVHNTVYRLKPKTTKTINNEPIPRR